MLAISGESESKNVGTMFPVCSRSPQTSSIALQPRGVPVRYRGKKLQPPQCNQTPFARVHVIGRRTRPQFAQTKTDCVSRTPSQPCGNHLFSTDAAAPRSNDVQLATNSKLSNKMQLLADAIPSAKTSGVPSTPDGREIEGRIIESAKTIHPISSAARTDLP